MAKVELKRTELEFDIYGTVVKCQRPTVIKLEQAYEELANASAADARGVWCKFLISLGFDQATLDGLEPEHMVTIIDAMTGLKKKSPTSG